MPWVRILNRERQAAARKATRRAGLLQSIAIRKIPMQPFVRQSERRGTQRRAD